MLKKLHILIIIFIIIILSASCARCVQCDIYDEEGYWVKDFGEYCGDYITTTEYEWDADDHAFQFYGGWAECYSY